MTRFWTLCSWCALLLVVGCDRQDPSPSSWSQWRGPDGLGISHAIDLPTYWGKDGTGIKWSAAIEGKGTSSPITVGDRVYVTSATARGEQVELTAQSFDLESGERLWRTTVVQRQREKRHHMNTAAGSTPVSDGNSLFVYFGSHLASLDLEGSMVWVKEIDPAYLEESVYAAGSSLVLSGDFVIVLRDRESADEQLTGWLAAFDKATGERVWKKEWKDTCCSYVTPLTIDREGKEELFVLLAGEAISFDPQTGKRVRRRKHAIRQPVASPVVEDNLICVASGAHHNRQARCWEIVEKDGKTSWKSRWKTERWVPEVSSPILMGGRLYLLTEKGILRSVDAKTGKLLWRVRLETGWYRASLLAGAGKLYALGESGVVSVVSSETGEIIAVNRLPGSNCLASPAVAGNCLLIRSERRLYCVTGTDEPVAEAA